MLVGTKKDLISKRAISQEEIVQFCKTKKLYYMESSAKDNSDGNVENVFKELAARSLKSRRNGAEDWSLDNEKIIRLNEDKKFSDSVSNLDMKTEGDRCC